MKHNSSYKYKIVGPSSVGKTTFAYCLKAYLLHNFNMLVPVSSLGDKLKVELSDRFPMIDFFSKPLSQGTRTIMRNHALRKREINPDYYLEGLPTFGIIDDVRYEHDYNMLKGYYSIGIFTPNEVNYDPLDREANNLARKCDFSILAKIATPYTMVKTLMNQ